jgi:hypothetical protein
VRSTTTTTKAPLFRSPFYTHNINSPTFQQ